MKTLAYAKHRYVLFRVILLSCFAILAIHLWQLQVVSSQHYRGSADRNRFRLIPVDAPRGIIYDRQGRILVRNVPSFAVQIVPSGLPRDPQERLFVLKRLGDLLNMPVSSLTDGAQVGDDVGSSEQVRASRAMGIEDILRERVISPYAPVCIATNVDRQAAFIIEEEHLKLPGVLVEAQPLRHYVEGPMMAHVVGYLGPIPSGQLQDYLADKKGDYQPDDLVGLAGVERSQENTLRGTKGQKHIEVDAFEREVASIALTPPTQGNNVVLTIDLELQRVVEDAVREGMRKAKSETGVAIALDPRNGEVLAMVSLPAFDDNLFSGGISYEDYARLLSDRSHPLVNHAISGQYPPGSTFKLVAASAVLEEHVVDRSTGLSCQGILYLPNRYWPDDPTKAQKFYCWNKAGHGSLNLVGGVAQSCDIYFYQVAGGYRDLQGLGIERLAKYAQLFGYGEPTGIALSGEAPGLVPSDRWKRQNYGEPWVTGDTYNAAIGQGYVLASPLQVVNATAAVANRGTLYRPQIVHSVTDANGRVMQSPITTVVRKIPVASENLALVRQGMLEAVDHGTAWLTQLPGLKVGGKTGTAEYPGLDEEGRLKLDPQGNLPTHAWFTCFAPYDNPEIALVVFLDGGGEGSQLAVPVAAKILRYYFNLPEPTPVPAFATPSTTSAAGT